MKRLLTSVLVALGLAASAHAVPVEWNLEGNVFINGNGTLSGTFVYDEETNEFSDLNITASAGDLFLCADSSCGSLTMVDSYAGGTFVNSGNGFTVGTGFFAGSFGVLLSNDGFFNVISLLFESQLTDAGGVVNVAAAFQWQCDGTVLCGRDNQSTPFRSVLGSNAVLGTATSVPAPGTLMLMALGLIALGRRRA